MELLYDYDYKLDTVISCQDLSARLWSEGKHLEALRVLQEALDIITSFNIIVPSTLDLAEIRKQIEQLLTRDSRLKAGNQPRPDPTITQRLTLPFMRSKNVDKVIEKAASTWQDHDFEGTVELLAQTIERQAAILPKHELKRLTDTYQAYRREWSNYLLDTVEKKYDELIAGKVRLQDTLLTELERLTVRAFKLAPSEQIGRSGSMLFKVLILFGLQEKMILSVTQIEDGALESARKMLQDVYRYAPLPEAGQLLNKIKEKQKSFKAALKMVFDCISSGQWNNAQVYYDKVMQVNHEHQEAHKLRLLFSDFQNVHKYLNTARLQGKIEAYEAAINTCRLALASRSETAPFQKLLLTISREFENALRKQIRQADAQPETIVSLIERFGKILPLSPYLEQELIQARERRDQFKSMVSVCEREIYENRFVLARERLNQIIETGYQSEVILSMDEQIKRGEQAIQLYLEAKNKAHHNEIEDGIKLCKKSLEILPIPAAQRLLKSIIIRLGFRGNFTLLTDDQEFRILTGRRFPVNRSDKSTKTPAIFFNEFPLDISRERHAEISADDEGYVLNDCHSPFGTFFNGEEITSPRLLPPQAIISFGHYARFQWRISGLASVNRRDLPINLILPSARLELLEPGCSRDELDRKWPNYAEAKRRTFILLGQEIQIGSHPDCTIRFTDKDLPDFAAALFFSTLSVYQLRRVHPDVTITVDNQALDKETLLRPTSSITVQNLTLKILT